MKSMITSCLSPFIRSWCAIFLFSVLAATVGSAESVRAKIQPPSARVSAPTFTLSSSSGQVISLSKYQGRIAVLNFWATECGGCRLEIPTFIEVANAYRSRGVAVVGISMDVWFEQLKGSKEGWDRVNPFISSHRINYTMLMGDDAVKAAFHLTELPVTVLVDPRGRIAATYTGIVDKDNLETNINTLLANK